MNFVTNDIGCREQNLCTCQEPLLNWIYFRGMTIIESNNIPYQILKFCLKDLFYIKYFSEGNFVFLVIVIENILCFRIHKKN